jgi:hypothetical protein
MNPFVNIFTTLTNKNIRADMARDQNIASLV